MNKEKNMNHVNKLLLKIFIISIGISITSTNKIFAQLFFKLSLNDGFYNDTVTLKVNNIVILKEQIIISDLTTGSTPYQITFEKDSLNSYILDKDFSKKALSKKIPYSKRLVLELTINKVKLKKRINLQKGQFIGFDLWHLDNGSIKIDFYQQKTKFEYY